jgi:hypothetical protein
MALFRVRQHGNRVELHGGSEVIWYEAAGIDLPPLTDHGFAIWHLLAAAIHEGFDIELDGPVADDTLENARLFARTWELWQPSRFREVRIERRGPAPGPRPAGRRPELAMFSAGVDSTTMFLRLGVRPERGTALTVHGMDYAPDNEAGFNALIDQSAAFLERQNYDRITLRTNAMQIVHGDHAWGLALAGHASIFADLFERAVFAADHTWEIDLAIHPWGSNHVSNRFFHGEGFAVHSLTEDLSRSQKMLLLANDPQALATISVCRRRDLRPRNCGVCQKCVRTKAAFLGMTGSIPDIFIDRRLTPPLVRAAFDESQITAANLHELFIRTRGLGPAHEVPGLAAAVARHGRRSRFRERLAHGLKGLIPRPWKRPRRFVREAR